MSQTETELLAAAQQGAPDNVIVEAAADAAATAENPSPSNIIADMEVALKLVKEFKVALVKLHPSVLAWIKKAL
jgi:hypothetical protein